jgi:hypothetical protein
MVTLSEVLAVFEQDPRVWCESEIAEKLDVEQSQLQAPLDHLLRMGRLAVQEAEDVCEICPVHSSCLLIAPSQRTYKLSHHPGETATAVAPGTHPSSEIGPPRG